MFAHPVAVPADIDDVTVVHQAIDQRGRHDFVAEDRAPLLKPFVGGQHGRGVFIARIDELEEQHGAVATHGQIPDLVDDEQGRVAQHASLASRPSHRVA